MHYKLSAFYIKKTISNLLKRLVCFPNKSISLGTLQLGPSQAHQDHMLSDYNKSSKYIFSSLQLNCRKVLSSVPWIVVCKTELRISENLPVHSGNVTTPAIKFLQCRLKIRVTHVPLC